LNILNHLTSLHKKIPLSIRFTQEDDGFRGSTSICNKFTLAALRSLGLFHENKKSS
jgi:hypothetical protein